MIKIKILFVIAHIGKGGGEAIQACKIIKEIKNQGHECKLLTLRTKQKLLDEPCETEYAGDLKFPAGIFKLYNRIKKIAKNYDVIQCFDINFSLSAAYLYGKKPIFIRMGINPYKEFKERKLLHYLLVLKLILPLVFGKVKLVVNSKSLQKEFQEYNPVFIPNGNKFSDIKKLQKKQIRKELGLPQNKKILVFTGKIIRRKNLEDVFDVLDSLSNIYFIILGQISEEHYGNKYHNQLMIKYTHLHLKNKFSFLGEKNPSEITKYLNASDFFVFPSKLEGSPNSIIEAMFAEIPVICSNNLAHRELIKHKKTGFIYHDKKELGAILKNCIDKKINTQRIKKEALVYVKKHHNIRDSAQKYIELYKKTNF